MAKVEFRIKLIEHLLYAKHYAKCITQVSKFKTSKQFCVGATIIPIFFSSDELPGALKG